ncbi:hypothetical protein [Jannaschia sp. CCS1]|uniref:hypothetical protein n=1 Tax=Jannaschia sp. (strain CCS1) TaxID=290400 RepID=UPI000303203D|nr:hypothetical protein [Jannaschia sp. CCS1]
MSDPGSLRWWQDTALITAGGVALAIWLWDGPVIFTPSATDTLAPATTDLGDLLDAGCLTGDHLRALAEGEDLTIRCYVDTANPVLLRDLPPEQRPFP